MYLNCINTTSYLLPTFTTYATTTKYATTTANFGYVAVIPVTAVCVVIIIVAVVVTIISKNYRREVALHIEASSEFFPY